MKIYLVGGAVRDKLLGLTIKENDWVVVGATPEKMLNLNYKPVGKDFPVFLHPITHEEYALARTEKKVSPGYTGFLFHASPEVTLEEDLKRRDLTINAMALNEQGELVDPFQGQEDLKKKILRHVSSAFSEDPVRILRTARFYARFANLGFSIAPETMQLMRAMVNNGEINALVPERVWQELERALHESAPDKFFEALRSCGALTVLFPELDRLFGVPNPLKWHPEIDSGVHTLMVLQQAAAISNDPLVRFAALVHDLGKGVTPMQHWPSHPGHEQSGIDLVKDLCARIKVPKSYRDLALLTARYHGEVHKAFELRPGTLLKILEKVDAFRRPERFEQFLLACEADARGRPGYENKPYPQREHFYQAYCAAKNVSAKDLLTEGYEHEALAEQLRQRRIAAINKKMGKQGE